AGGEVNVDILVIPLDVVDGNLYQEGMLLVTGDGVYRADVKSLHEMKPSDPLFEQAKVDTGNGSDEGIFIPFNRLTFATDTIRASYVKTKWDNFQQTSKAADLALNVVG